MSLDTRITTNNLIVTFVVIVALKSILSISPSAVEMGTWQEKMERARRLHRPSLKNWERDNMHEHFPDFVKEMKAKSNYSCFNPHDEEDEARQIPVVLNAAKLTREEFYKYEKAGIPAVLRGIPAGYDGGECVDPWPAQERWQLKSLMNDSTLLERKFKCGEDDDGHNIKVRMNHFLSYMLENNDDSPLYVFDSNFDEDKEANRILHDYRVPSYFRDDLFGLVSESRRPPYRWFLIGPERSGTCVHIDPLGTSAWNTLISGQKRWVLFPPGISKSIVKGKGLIRYDEDDEAIHYFMNILPRIKRKARSLRSTEEYQKFRAYEFTQNPGETVFVPNGWWHAVLNLSHTVAVTQNFCSPRNFDQVWRKTRSGRKRMAWKWLCRLEVEYPDLYQRARAMNKADGYLMKYEEREREEEERKKREKERRQKEEQQTEWGFDSSSQKKKKKRRHSMEKESRATVSP